MLFHLPWYHPPPLVLQALDQMSSPPGRLYWEWPPSFSSGLHTIWPHFLSQPNYLWSLPCTGPCSCHMFPSRGRGGGALIGDNNRVWVSQEQRIKECGDSMYTVLNLLLGHNKRSINVSSSANVIPNTLKDGHACIKQKMQRLHCRTWGVFSLVQFFQFFHVWKFS